MKKSCFLLLYWCFVCNLFCYTGLMAGADDLNIVKTRQFDIIYPSSAKGAASLLYDNADNMYDEIASYFAGQYDFENDFRTVVVITDNLDSYNAFNTPVPYNRIVMFNTSTNSIDDLSSSFSQGFLQTFRHELTHAFTWHMKNGFWNGVSNIFGDAFTPGFLLISSGFAEGAAVASESANGVDGRLNDGFATHITKQAKIEDCFPSYYDVRGANDSTIYSLCYYFHGAFHDYLQKKYGMEKYVQWWNHVVNLTRPGESWAFKSVYGNSIRMEWNDFAESYNVPDVIKDPIGEGVVDDFFLSGDEISSINDCSSINSSGARFSELHVCDSGLYYAVDLLTDRLTRKIFFVPYGQMGDESEYKQGNEAGGEFSVKPEVVFTQQIMEGFMPSKDGRFLALSCYTNAAANNHAFIRVYDTVSKRFFDIKDERLKNASIIMGGAGDKASDAPDKVVAGDKEYFIVAHKFDSPNNVLVIKKFLFDDNKISGVADVFSQVLPLNNIACNFTDLGNGTFAFIKKDYGDFAIDVCDLSGNIIGEYKLPEGVRIRQLSENNGNIYFSWAKKDSMARLGVLNLESGLFTFSNVDISGGIFNPVVLNNDGDVKKFAYIGTFFKENKILTFDENSKILADSEAVACVFDENSDFSTAFSKSENEKYTDLTSVAEPYKRLKNLHQGFLLPISIYSSNMIGENYGNQSVSQFLPFGLTYAAANPWNGGGINDDFLIMTAGWSYLTNSFGIEFRLGQGTGTSLFISALDLKSEFDMKGWKQSAGELILGSGFNFGKTSSFIAQNNLRITGGRQNNLSANTNALDHISFWKPEAFEANAPASDNVAFNVSDILSLKYSNIVSRGPGKYESGGVSFGVGAGYVYDSVAGQRIVVSPALSVHLPKLIPITQKRGLTYNLPLRLKLSLMPGTSSFGLTGAMAKKAKSSVLDFNCESVLFGVDIQKAIPYFDFIYVNEFYITAGYNSSIATYTGYKKDIFQLPYMFEYFGNLGNGKSVYLDSVYMDVVLKLTPNIGLLANPVAGAMFNIYGRAGYSFNVLPGEKNGFIFSFGIRGDF